MRAGRPRSRVGLLPSLLLLKGLQPYPCGRVFTLGGPSWNFLAFVVQPRLFQARGETGVLQLRSKLRRGRGWFGFRLSERAAGISCVSFADRREPGPDLPNRGRDARKKSF